MDLLGALAALTRRERNVVVLWYVENLNEADSASHSPSSRIQASSSTFWR
ncbi:hypothetical protein [Kribbella sancticallisti]